MQELSLVRIEEVVVALDRATTVQEVKNHIDAAKAAEVYAKQAKLGKDLELKVFQYVKKAERKLGEMLAAAKAVGQMRQSNDRLSRKKEGVPAENTFTLEEAGISRKLSSRAQKLAAVPKEEFDKAVAEGKEPRAMESANGKPKKPATGRRGRVTPQLDRAREIIRENIEAEKPVSPHKLEQQHGISHVTFDMAITAELARKQALSEPPEITPDMLSMTAQQKLELAIRQHKEKLNREFHAAVTRRADEFIENTIGPILRKREAEATRVIESRKGVMTKETFRKIWGCLHPDRILDPEQKPKYQEAFTLFEKVKTLLLNEKESPTRSGPCVPTTPAEWEALKRQANERKAKRGQNGGTNIEKSSNAQ